MKQIYDDATFNAFVSAVAGGNKTLNARLTQDAATLSLSAATISAFESIEDYKGTFDGNNKTISGLTKPLFNDLLGVVKNLTLNSTISITSTDQHWGIFANQITPSLEVDDVPGLQNCTASGSITWTPASAISSYMTLGGLVGNNRGGTITGCTNNATVTFASSVTHSNQPSVGGVVGRTQKGGDLKTQGEISNCTNNGTVVCAAQFSQGAYIGGVLGYQVEKAETMSGCTNHGLVKVTSTFSTSGALHLAGVAGLAKGTVENCTNASDGVVTSEACSVSSYLCQGGVVGRLNDDSGRVYETLTNAGTLNVAAEGASSNAYVGGVVGRCNEGAAITGFSNSGNINCSSTGFEDDLFIGGIVASNETSSSNVLQNCNSTGGTLSYTGALTNGNLYIGGVVGYSTKEVANCTNAMTLNVGGNITPEAGSKYYSTGGIVGSMSQNAPITSCLNTGAITLSQQINEVSGKEGYTRLGGIAGRTEGSITNCSNGGIVTFSGKNHCDKGNPMVGGLVGDTPDDSGLSISGKYSSASATNFGNVVINTTVQSKKYVYAGGVVGRLRCSVTATNAGQINVTNLTCTALYAGGIVGSAITENASISSCQNLATGDFNISGLNSSNSSYTSYVGGIVGYAEKSSITFSGCTNAGDVVLTSGSKAAGTLMIGGIAGASTCPVSNCTNNGLVSNAAPMNGGSTKYLQIGGVVGYNNSNSPLSNCHNTGNVTNTANSKSYLFIGGITSESEGGLTNCDNTGNITNSGSITANTKWICIGGVAGRANSTLTSCSNGTASHAGGTISNSGTSNEDVNIGGVAGLNEGKVFTACYNKGNVTNSGNSNEGYNVNVGGLTGWSSNGSSYASTCYNTGAISNTGVGSNSGKPGARIGGLLGCAKGLHSFSGSSFYNNGTVTENSSSYTCSVGGICGFYLDEDAQEETTSFAGTRNLVSGTITVSGSHHTASAGGILGCTDHSVSLSTCSNASAINYTNCTTDNVRVGGILGVTGGSGAPNLSGTDSSHWTVNTGNIKFTTCTVADQVNAGGIFGSWENDIAATIQYCKNSGTITTNTQEKDSEDICTDYMSYFSYFAGIGTCTDGGKGKTFRYCQNTGDIKLYFKTKHRVGGITALCAIPPSYCDVRADLIVGMPAGPNEDNGGIGGIAAVLYNSSSSTLTFDNLFFNGNVKAQYNHNDKRSYITGLLAARPSNKGTTLIFNNCKVGGKVYCDQWSGYYRSGAFTGHNIGTGSLANAHLISCSGCEVLSGMIVQYGTGSDTITTNLTYRQAVGNTGPNSSQSGNIPGVSVVNSISPNIAF